MALHDSVLEEFGLAPMWVRRGLAAVPETTPAVDAVQAQTSTQTSAKSGEASVTNQAPVRQDRPPVSPANDALPNSTRTSEQPHAPLQSREQAVGVERQIAPRASDASRDAPTDDPATQRTPPMRGQTQPSAQSPRAADPSMSEAPSDDFAWFDDLPSTPPTQSRTDAPQPPSIQTLDWDALSERVAGCQLCRLCEKRTNTVFGVGDRHADWMLIGEAPGENEDRQGEPFVGQAGKLLDNMLRSLTLARDANVYIANVIKCRPPGNRNPEPEEVARCEPYLQRQVALVKPKLIVALGRFAAQSLLKTEASISSLRGRVHEYEGVPVIVTYHPAYLLRSLPDKAKAWADLCLARDTWRKLEGGDGAAANVAKQ
ncbi:uracil-DNA glycosylase family 4 [Paraburkholderia sp. GAS199]|uniref:uracil-DNA glycosylase n=1 Tax=Paraburkholderia sp. GAS199 TaxID=3035126 RepID=UPI003D22CDDF